MSPLLSALTVETILVPGWWRLSLENILFDQ